EQFVQAEDAAASREEMRAVVSGRHTRDFRNRCIHRDGRIVNMMWSAYWSENDDLMIAVGRDITEREEFEKALLWRTAFFEAQVDSALDGILVVDIHGKKVLQNERLVDIWKIPR